jgi:hypothetical protein
MMGTIVLTMLLGWFCAVMALAIWSRDGEHAVKEIAVEEAARVTGAPVRSGEDVSAAVRR